MRVSISFGLCAVLCITAPAAEAQPDQAGAYSVQSHNQQEPPSQGYDLSLPKRQYYPNVAKFIPVVGSANPEGPGSNHEETCRAKFAAFRQAAEYGNPEAQFNLGLMYWNGDSTRSNYKNAVKWWRKAAEVGNAQAFVSLSTAYSSGRGVPTDLNKFVQLAEEAADRGCPSGLFNVGYAYEHGDPLPEDMEKALSFYRRAAQMNDPSALSTLGCLHQCGKGVPQDYLQARHYQEKAAALGSPEAFDNLGMLYERGLGVPKNLSIAEGYYKQAIRLNNCAAETHLANLYMYMYLGAGVDTEPTQREVVALISDAANHGDPTAQWELATLYMNGRYVKADTTKAVTLFKQAAEHGCGGAKVGLAMSYLNRFLLNDQQEGIKIMKEAASEHFCDAEYNLGLMYEHGADVGKDASEARTWFERAASDGSDDAQRKLSYSRELSAE